MSATTTAAPTIATLIADVVWHRHRDALVADWRQYQQLPAEQRLPVAPSEETEVVTFVLDRNAIADTLGRANAPLVSRELHDRFGIDDEELSADDPLVDALDALGALSFVLDQLVDADVERAAAALVAERIADAA